MTLLKIELALSGFLALYSGGFMIFGFQIENGDIQNKTILLGMAGLLIFGALFGLALITLLETKSGAPTDETPKPVKVHPPGRELER